MLNCRKLFLNDPWVKKTVDVTPFYGIPTAFSGFLPLLFCPHCADQAFLSRLSCPLLSYPGCHILALLCQLPCAVVLPSYLVPLSCPATLYAAFTLWAVLSLLSCPGLSSLSCPGSPVKTNLSGRPVPSCLVLAVTFWLSYPLFPILAVLSWLFSLTVLSRFSCPGCPTPALLSSATLCQHSCPELILYFPCCHDQAVLSGPSCSSCSVQTNLSGRPIQTDLSRLCPVPFYAYCHVSDVLSQL